ncbi:MAG: type II toxin-antitoxin system YafQ family toxin [Candidatus Riflebacteria bacterium]|nr:type II toxin-antitoxin system YafQ family toxin [Candidatus Riflebacteria bacterium]
MKYTSQTSNQFEKDVKKVKKQGKDIELLKGIMLILLNGDPLDAKYKDHDLRGNWKGYRELHIEPDWLLIYKRFEVELIIRFERTGSHSELFSK